MNSSPVWLSSLPLQSLVFGGGRPQPARYREVWSQRVKGWERDKYGYAVNAFGWVPFLETDFAGLWGKGGDCKTRRQNPGWQGHRREGWDNQTERVSGPLKRGSRRCPWRRRWPRNSRRCHAVRLEAMWMRNDRTRSDFKLHPPFLTGRFFVCLFPVCRAGFHQFSRLIPASFQAAAVGCFQEKSWVIIIEFQKPCVQLACLWIPSGGWLHMGPKGCFVSGADLGARNLNLRAFRNWKIMC